MLGLNFINCYSKIAFMSVQEEIDKLAEEISNCQKCPLYKSATQAVPGGPNPDTDIVFIGEAPGYWEDQKGIPFCGRSGQLLNKLLGKINLKRGDVFICNILKHRPPNNRDPQPDEIEACTPWLKQQLLTIEPKIVITLGRFALNYFIPNAYISKVHGQPKSILWQNLNLLLYPLYHPAAGLRSGNVKQDLIDDFLRIPKIISEENKMEFEIEEAKEKSKDPEQESLF
jgi:uracil-DNA glycosylase family 4